VSEIRSISNLKEKEKDAVSDNRLAAGFRQKKRAKKKELVDSSPRSERAAGFWDLTRGYTIASVPFVLRL
jgi:hypothetical protein